MRNIDKTPWKPGEGLMTPELMTDDDCDIIREYRNSIMSSCQYEDWHTEPPSIVVDNYIYNMIRKSKEPEEGLSEIVKVKLDLDLCESLIDIEIKYIMFLIDWSKARSRKTVTIPYEPRELISDEVITAFASLRNKGYNIDIPIEVKGNRSNVEITWED